MPMMYERECYVIRGAIFEVYSVLGSGFAEEVYQEALELEMGKRGRNWIERDFSWSSVANKMISAYSWLLHGGNRPNHVIASER